MEIFAAAFFGLIIGSFLNVCIFRFIAGESVIYPSSHCPICRHTLPWYDLIPVMSYLLLRGKCRYCHASISRQYPLVELLFALISGLLAWRYGISKAFFVYALFSGIFLVLSVIDFRTYRLPDAITIPALCIAIPASHVFLGQDWLNVFLGALSGFALLRSLSFYFRITRHKECLGSGDAKLMAVIGALVGFESVAIVLFLAAISAYLYALITKTKGMLAFGPGLSFGAVLQFIFLFKLGGW